MELHVALPEHLLEDEREPLEEEHAEAELRRPEEDDSASLSEHTVELLQDLADLVLGEMLHDSEVVDALDGPVRQRDLQDAAVQGLATVRVDAFVEPKCIQRDVEPGDGHPVANVRVDLAAAATGVQQMSAGLEICPHEVIQGATDDESPVERRYGVVQKPARLRLFV